MLGGSRFSLSFLAFTCAALPTITVHITWLVAASNLTLEWCNPYWSHCHSISATGREPPQFFIFKLLMIPSALLMLIYWVRLSEWLKSETTQKKSATLVRNLGIAAAISLVIYTSTLGAIGDLYALPRRMGVVGYFALTAFSHLILLHALSERVCEQTHLKKPFQWLLSVSMLLLLLGVLSALLGFVWSEYQNWDNAFEWWFAILMVSQFVCVGIMHRQHTKQRESQKLTEA